MARVVPEDLANFAKVIAGQGCKSGTQHPY